MDIYKEKSREFFNRADFLYSKLKDINYNYDDYNFLCLDENEYKNIRILVSSIHGLICEYYLKGILLCLLDETYQIDENKKSFIPILDSLTDEDKYNLLIGNNREIINRMSLESGLKKNSFAFLKENNLTTSQHNIYKMLEQIRDNYTVVSQKLENKIDELLNKEELTLDEENDLHNFIKKQQKLEVLEYLPEYLADYISEYIEDNHEDIKLSFDDILSLIESSSIKNAFPEARYGNLSINYDIDSEMLQKTMVALQKLSIDYDECFLLTNGKYIKRIYPDKNSKIYILNSNNIITKVFKRQDINTFIDTLCDNHNNLLTPSQKDSLESYICPLNSITSSCTPEYGYDNIILDLERNTLGEITPLDLIKTLSSSIYVDKSEYFCYYQDGKLKTSHPSEELESVLNSYESELKNNIKFIEDQSKLFDLFAQTNISESLKIKMKIHNIKST